MLILLTTALASPNRRQLRSSCSPSATISTPQPAAPSSRFSLFSMTQRVSISILLSWAGWIHKSCAIIWSSDHHRLHLDVCLLNLVAFYPVKMSRMFALLIFLCFILAWATVKMGLWILAVYLNFKGKHSVCVGAWYIALFVGSFELWLCKWHPCCKSFQVYHLWSLEKFDNKEPCCYVYLTILWEYCTRFYKAESSIVVGIQYFIQLLFTNHFYNLLASLSSMHPTSLPDTWTNWSVINNETLISFKF